MSKSARYPIYAFAALIWISSFFMDPSRTNVTVFSNYDMPELCITKRLFEAECWGCGLTRSCLFFCHGDFNASFEMHKAGWLVVSFVTLVSAFNVWKGIYRRMFKKGPQNK